MAGAPIHSHTICALGWRVMIWKYCLTHCLLTACHSRTPRTVSPNRLRCSCTAGPDFLAAAFTVTCGRGKESSRHVQGMHPAGAYHCSVQRWCSPSPLCGDLFPFCSALGLYTSMCPFVSSPRSHRHLRPPRRQAAAFHFSFIWLLLASVPAHCSAPSVVETKSRHRLWCVVRT